MANVRGNAAISWTDSDDVTTERVLLLREPFREIRPAHTQSVFPADSLDFTQRQVFTVGEGVDELIVRVRYSDDPQGLLDLIKAGSKKRTLTYVPDLDDADRRYACYLISPLSPVGLGMDADMGTSHGHLEVELRLRKTDNTPFQDHAQKQDRIFSWRAGGRIEEFTFSRADTASYAAIGAGGSYGTLTTAASGLARTNWMSTASSRGPRTFPALLLESSRPNRVLQSEGGTSLWTKTSVTVTTGQADPRGGTKAWLVNDASTTVTGTLNQVFSLVGSTRAVLSLFLKQGTTALRVDASLRTTNGATTHIRIRVTWSSGYPTQAQSGGVAVGNPEAWRNGFYRVQARTTANLAAANYKVAVSPASTAAAAKANVYLFGVMVEQ